MAGINTSTADRGLEQCLQGSNVDAALIQKLMDPTGLTQWKNLEGFYYFFEGADNLTAGIEACLEPFTEFRKARASERPNHAYSREASHLRQAWYTAKRLVAELDSTAPDAEVDWEAALPQGVHDDLAKQWTARYNFGIRPEFDPDKTTITRYFRAFTKNIESLKALDMKAHKSTGNTTGLDTPGGINTLYQWYRHARTMAYAIAKAGNHTFKCKEKGDVLMAPLDVNQNYVEDAYERGLHRNSLTWLMERDKMTRTLMTKHMKEGFSQGVAMQMAWTGSQFHWNDSNLFKDRLKATQPSTGAGAGGGNGAPVAMPTKERPRSRTPLVRTPKGKGKKRNKDKKKRRETPPRDDRRDRTRSRSRSRGKGKKEDTDKKVVLLCPNARGKRTCDEWNLGLKCKDKNCEKLHDFCSRRLNGGGACGKKHPAYKCTNEDRVKDPRNRSPWKKR